MKHLTKEINQLGRSIAARVLQTDSRFVFDERSMMSDYFVHGEYDGWKVAFKILVKASVDKFGNIPCFQMDEEVIRKIDAHRIANVRKIIIVLVDTRTGEISWVDYDELVAGYIDEGVNFPVREPSRFQGPVFWNSVWKTKSIGHMSQSERDKLIMLRTKNKADKHQKSIFDI